MTLLKNQPASSAAQHATAETSVPAEKLAQIVQSLSESLAKTAVERDIAGGTPYAQRQAIRDSGLLKLLIPVEHGGLGGSWQQIYGIIRQIARVDSSIAQVFAFQFLMLTSVRLYGSETQWQFYFRQTAAQNLWWGNALNPLDSRTLGTRTDDGYLFEGHKSFCSGAIDSDYLILSAIEAGTSRFLVAAVPTTREGIQLNDDWDNIGQRQTDSGSAAFTRLKVYADELLMEPGPLSSPFSSLRSLVAQLIFTNIYLGISEGALEQAVQYTLSSSRVWTGSLASSIDQDPYTLLHYGEFWGSLHAASVLADHAAVLMDQAWQQELSLSEQQRGELALAVFSAKTHITKAGLK